MKRQFLIYLLLLVFWPVAIFAQVAPEQVDSAHDHSMEGMPGMEEMSGMGVEGTMQMMSALYGPYIHTREASGTAWQPDSTPMEGFHFNSGDWSMMVHGFATGIYNDQGGKRGDEKFYSTNMGMFMAEQKVGEGTFGFKSMLSLEPLMGDSGYPELLQTGETANGSTELIDRQHPHDLFMELAMTYSYDLTPQSSIFVYGGLPGEPALGPAAFMHRWSGQDIPDAPITHHWLDSTHITEGVVTLGTVLNAIKLESSIFNGREPNEDRWDIETRQLDSYSFRATYNFSEDWSSQVSYGYLDSPEELHPETSTRRITASAAYNVNSGDDNWATTAAWGRNYNDPGNILDGFLLESTVQFSKKHTLFARVENVQKDELFDEGDPQAGDTFRVNKLSAGYIYDFPQVCPHLILGVGAEGSWAVLPNSLDDAYGDTPFSFLLFMRAKIG